MSEVSTQTVSVRGRIRSLPAVDLPTGARIVVDGGMLRTAEIHDELWLEARNRPEPGDCIDALREARIRADLLTFSQPLTRTEPIHDYRIEFDNYAVAEIESYDLWLKGIKGNSRRSIRKADEHGLTTRVVPFDDTLVEGIVTLFNESPIRQGKRFWHYGKPAEVVRREQSSYLERSSFIGVFDGDLFAGFVKVVFIDDVADLMQIIASSAYFSKFATHALLSAAVRECERRGARSLVWGAYSYGGQKDSGLISFKRHNGFVRVDVPRYFVPLTVLGRVALGMNVHHGVTALIPAPVRSAAVRARGALNRLRAGRADSA